MQVAVELTRGLWAGPAVGAVEGAGAREARGAASGVHLNET